LGDAAFMYGTGGNGGTDPIGTIVNGSDALPNTGNGGMGGGSTSNSQSAGGMGGSGIITLSYLV
jgi:hypothetical protein